MYAGSHGNSRKFACHTHKTKYYAGNERLCLGLEFASDTVRTWRLLSQSFEDLVLSLAKAS